MICQQILLRLLGFFYPYVSDIKIFAELENKMVIPAGCELLL